MTDLSAYLSKPRDMLADSIQPDNPLADIEALKRQVAQLFSRVPQFQTASDATVDGNLGSFGVGELTFGDGIPDDPDFPFTGVRMGYPGFTYVNGTWQFVAVNQNKLMVGIGVDGRFYAAGGAFVLDDLGASRTGINFFDRWDASNAGNNRRLEIGTTLPAGATVPVPYFSMYDSTAVSNLQTNGDFELGALTDWTQTGSTWDVITSPAHGGTYAARLTLTDVIDSNLQTNGGFETADFTGWTTGGTGTWSVVATSPRSGTYHAKLVQTGSQTGTLTTNLGGTPRIAVTAGLDYAVFGAADYAINGGGFTVQTLSIKWYTATSGGSLISTDSMTFGLGSGVYSLSAMLKTAPATAAGAEVVISLTRAAGGGTSTIYIDDIQFGAVSLGTLYTNFGGGTPRMAVTAGTSYQLGGWVETDQPSTFFQTASVAIRWYDAITGGSLLSTSTTPISVVSGLFINSATVLIAPVGALGAEVYFVFERGTNSGGTQWGTTAHVYVDDVTFGSVSVNRAIYWLPNFTFMNGPADFQEIAAPSTPANGYGSFYWNSTDHGAHVFDSSGMDNPVHRGLIGAGVKVDTTGKTTIASRVIKANTLSTRGHVWIKIPFQILNTKGTNGTVTIDVDWGGTNVWSILFDTISSGAATESSGVLSLHLTNIGATNTQRVFLEYIRYARIAASTLSGAGITTSAWAEPTKATTSDQTLTVSITLSAGAGATWFFETYGAEWFGPYLA